MRYISKPPLLHLSSLLPTHVAAREITKALASIILPPFCTEVFHLIAPDCTFSLETHKTRYHTHWARKKHVFTVCQFLVLHTPFPFPNIILQFTEPLRLKGRVVLHSPNHCPLGLVMSFLFFTSFTRSLTSNPFNFLLFSLHAHLILLFYFLQATGSTEAQQGSSCRVHHVQR